MKIPLEVTFLQSDHLQNIFFASLTDLEVGKTVDEVEEDFEYLKGVLKRS